MSEVVRDKALAILLAHEHYTPPAVHTALIDLQRNAKSGDEHLLHKYLSYPDDMVVSAVLFAWIHVYKPVPDLLQLLLRFANGDNRDNGEMPIQTQAIEGLSIFARENPEALSKIISVANDTGAEGAPRARAWKCLAEMYGITWKGKYTCAMIYDSESEVSMSIRMEIQKAIEDRNGQPLPS